MMKKKIGFCVMICIVVVASYFYAHINQNSYLYNRNAETSTFGGTGILLPNEQVMQSFVSGEDSIDGLNLKVALFGNVDKVSLEYRILDEDAKELRCVQVKASQLENNKFNHLPFDTIEDTQNKKYTLVLRVDNSDEQNGIGFYIEPASQNEQQLVIRDTETDGTLVTRVLCYGFDMETFVVLLGMIVFVVGFMKVLFKIFR